MNCPKCIIDSGRLQLTATHLADMLVLWDRTFEDMQRDLTEEEYAAHLTLQDQFCAFSDVLDDNIARWNSFVCELAKKHSTRAPSQTAGPE